MHASIEPLRTVDRTDAAHTGIDRLPLIDALRGFALAGVLLVNLGGFSLYYFMDDAGRAALPSAGFDAWARLVVQILVQDKALTLFSLLFGLGIAMQVERAEATGAGIQPVVRRLLVLLGIGLVHAHLFWWGDILTVYAMLAFVLLSLRRLPDSALLIGGLGLGLFWFLLASIAAALKPDGFPEQARFYADTFAAFSGGDITIALHRNTAVAHWMWLEIWGLFPFVLARFMLGYWAGRKGLLHDPAAHRGLLRAILFVGGIVGIASVVAIEWIESMRLTESLLHGNRIGEFGLRLLRRIGPLGMGVAYAAGFALLFLRPQWRRWLQLLAPAGRMALSNYLMQTLVCIWLFYGIGLGIGPSGGFVARLSVWAILFGLQMAFSTWWLARFRLGPMEWVWRSIADGRPAPMRLRASSR